MEISDDQLNILIKERDSIKYSLSRINTVIKDIQKPKELSKRKKDELKKIKQTQDYCAREFEYLWKLYPNTKGAKENSKQKFLKLGIQGQLPSWQWMEARIKFLVWEHEESKKIKGWAPDYPNASTWFNGQRWMDDVDQELVERYKSQSEADKYNARNNEQ